MASETSASLTRRVMRTRIAASGLPAVAHAVDRVDSVERGIDGEELVPYALHVRSDRGVVDDQVCFAHQLVAILDVARELGERVHHPELRQRERDGSTLPAYAEALQVERERAALEALLGRRRLAREIGAAKQRRDARHEVRQAHVLGEIVVGTQTQAG